MTLAHTDCSQRPATRPAPFNPIALLITWASLARQRRALAALDSTQLDDIGLTAQDAEIEANRAVWDVPSHWRH